MFCEMWVMPQKERFFIEYSNHTIVGAATDNYIHYKSDGHQWLIFWFMKCHTFVITTIYL